MPDTAAERRYQRREKKRHKRNESDVTGLRSDQPISIVDVAGSPWSKQFTRARKVAPEIGDDVEVVRSNPHGMICQHRSCGLLVHKPLAVLFGKSESRPLREALLQRRGGKESEHRHSRNARPQDLRLSGRSE